MASAKALWPESTCSVFKKKKKVREAIGNRMAVGDVHQLFCGFRLSLFEAAPYFV